MTMDARRIKGIIYDCDGVLVDSVESNVAYYNHILTRFDLPVLDESWMNLVLTGTGKGVLEALFRGSPFIGDALELQRQLPPEAFLDLVKPEPRVHDVLRRVRMRYHTAVATNRGKSLDPLLEMLELKDLFDVIVTSGDVTRHKPDPQCVSIILEHLGLEPGEVLYVGDSDVDRETAARAGTPFAAYRNTSLKADLHLPDHTHLLRVLDLSPGTFER